MMAQMNKCLRNFILKKQILKKVTVFLLALVMLGVGAILPMTNQIVYASAEENYEMRLTGADISEEYIEQLDEEVEMKYREYIVYDGPVHIEMEQTPIDQEYGSVIYEYGIDPNDYVSNPDHIFDIAALRMIHRNINIMNELAQEDVGFISEDYEFVFFQEDEYVQPRWAFWGVQLKWNKLSVCADSDFATLISSVFLTGHLIFDIQSLYDTLVQIQTDEGFMQYLLNQAYFYMPADLQMEMAECFSLDVIAVLTESLVNTVDIFFSSNLAWTILDILYGYFAPSLEDCIIILLNSVVYYRGISVTACWFPTWFDKWGFSIKLI